MVRRVAGWRVRRTSLVTEVVASHAHLAVEMMGRPCSRGRRNGATDLAGEGAQHVGAREEGVEALARDVAA